MRAFNVREGFGRKDDQLPVKFFKPLAGEGPTAGVALDRVEFNNALDLYYQMMGWTENGIPAAEKYAELGIEWVNQYL
jgi:aldehyde:ferredoxin oxidoreductase